MAVDTHDTRVADKIGLARRGVGVAGPGRPPSAPRKGRGKTPLGRAGKTLVLFALPSLLLLVLLNVYPVVYSFLQSLQQGTPSTLPWQTPFVGFENYANVLTSESFRNATTFTVVFTVVGVFGSWLVGLALALLLRTRIPGNGFFKVLLLLPWIVPVVVSATSWNWLVATPQSPVPIILERLGFPDANFLGDPVLAQVVVCVFKVWISFPFMLMMMSSALASVDTNVYEAAKMDGASAWQAFRGVTLPIISRTTYISWVLMTIFCVNDFPTIFLLTQGGPVNATTSLIVLAYQQAFQNLQTGPATAVAFMMTAVLVLVSTLLYRQIKKADIE
ncbi:carbohydrate ABC transporter permease [Clavibacter michiganensis]|uniref:Transporter n=1 Tax=Clavibacter michiganensis subsp. insidiosus TaxID=33014 RepID=A0A0D5CF47_9MICO|nr:sugar ABC transporter permease [Clavibacter michiganensis]AJW77877.1 transporter [Clavibacter michiganensis subsp. insidiosus]AWF97035.1 transporter [Clavibacter michiganensis subsp. insidiosus]